MGNRDIYIEILNYGKAHLGLPIKYADLLRHLRKRGYEFEEYAVWQFVAALFVNRSNPNGNNPVAPPEDDGDYFLEHQGYFNLLEHEELASARTASNRAMVIAIAAIMISAIFAAISIHFTKKELGSVTRIEASQMAELDSREIETLLSELIEEQAETSKSIMRLEKLISAQQKVSLKGAESTEVLE